MNTLKAIWEEVLQVEEIQPSDNFFDLGGDSFACLKIVAMAKEKGISVTMRDIFEKQTLEAICGAGV